jgi:hypothetical protein
VYEKIFNGEPLNKSVFIQNYGNIYPIGKKCDISAEKYLGVDYQKTGFPSVCWNVEMDFNSLNSEVSDTQAQPFGPRRSGPPFSPPQF